MRLHRDADGGISAANFFERDAVGEEVGSGATIFFWERQAQEAQRSHFAYEIVRKCTVPVHFFGARLDLLFREFAAEVANHLLLGVEREVHVGPPGFVRRTGATVSRVARAGRIARARCAHDYNTRLVAVYPNMIDQEERERPAGMSAAGRAPNSCGRGRRRPYIPRRAIARRSRPKPRRRSHSRVAPPTTTGT